MKLARLALAAAAVCSSLIANAEIRWIDKDFDFGLFKEITGPKTGTSSFVNLGPDTISVIAVKPSCGCTSSDFSDAPLAPGDTAFIHYTYDPTMRTGKFDKSVRVTLSDGSRHKIRITGNVLGTPESLATLFPVDAGVVRLSDSVIDAGRVIVTRSPISFVSAYILSTDSLSARLVPTDKALTATPSTPVAGPGDIVTFSIALDARRLNKYGPVEIPMEIEITPTELDNSKFKIQNSKLKPEPSASKEEPSALKVENSNLKEETSNSEVQNSKFKIQNSQMSFRAFVLPDADDLRRRQQGKNPSADAAPARIDLGSVSGNDPLTTEITITNNGNAPLKILRIFADSDAVTFPKVPSVVKKGKTVRIPLKIAPEALPDGPAQTRVGIITNDPLRPEIYLPLSYFKL